MLSYAASFDEQLSPVAPFLFYVVIAGIIFVETGLLIGFFLPTDIMLSEDKIIVREPLRVRGMRWDSIQVCKDGGDALLLIQRGARRSRQGRLLVPLGRGQFTQVRKRAVEQVWQQHRSSHAHADQPAS